LRKATTTLEGEEVKIQVKQVFEIIKEIQKEELKIFRVSQNSIRRFLPSTPFERG
jgi:predicted DNA-binding antitoxin AbrB/MazE fold protein